MTGHNTGAGVREGREIRRGTSNTNDRGNSSTRRRRREWLVETYPADVDVRTYRRAGEVVLVVPVDPLTLLDVDDGMSARLVDWETAQVEPACRCARCGKLLVVDTVTCDRIFPGVDGGKYGTPSRDRREKRTNVRPHCGLCASLTGARGPRPNARRKATK